MNYKKLSECADFREERTTNISLDNYVTTENMLENKGGITSPQSLPNVRATSAYKKGDILLSNIRPYFRKIWLASKDGSCSNDVLVLKPNNGVNALFLYYVLSDNNFFNYSTVTSKGTKMPRGTPNAIMKYLVPDVSPQVQKRIAEILFCYDCLIKNNSERISLLKREALEIYKEWFIRFRFPGHENINLVESKIGFRIPDIFKVARIQDVLSYYIGGGWGEDYYSEQFPVSAAVIRGADFADTVRGNYFDYPKRFHKKSNYGPRQLKPLDIIFEISGGTAEQPVGRPLIVTKGNLRANKNLICASFCKLLRCNENIIDPMYFYYWLNFLYDTRIVDRYQLQSTGITNFNFDFFLRKGFVVLPTKEIMRKFSEIVGNIYDQIDNLGFQNKSLADQRDLLLPRLISGKLEVN